MNKSEMLRMRVKMAVSRGLREVYAVKPLCMTDKQMELCERVADAIEQDMGELLMEKLTVKELKEGL